ncbi:Uncharacterized conserved protein, contains GH25 family domain [Hymenobacter gelipurpurascens]|uniref:Uncharacterized conserved protein, contains GH25 family domain n=1 Tax=Hymenobacter gelipurpurascens TaxID=89968 RepID=A0A212SZZ7_9BACT|nr:DUF4198 domain-containing protein [Hymenobacter gelipurpurascens]SNC59358.1 Uncharacterized conserved protein, contains GH25 family domain [Hymenobacter gelipurpurascens]
MKRVSRLLVLPFVLLAGTVVAREFWLEPAQFTVLPGTTMQVRIFTGENFRGTHWKGHARRITQLLHATPTGLQDLTSPAADTLQTTLTFRQPGTHLVALATDNAFLTMEPQPFAAYLRAEGLEHVLAQRKERGEAEKPAREAYRRCATTLLQVGAPVPSDTARAWSRPTGLALEILPEQNPYFLKPGMSITLRVLAEGRPVAGQLVRVWQRGVSPAQPPLQLHSNQNGRVLLRLLSPGHYLISTVRMVPSSNRTQADWQSTWSTLTFAFSGKQ